MIHVCYAFTDANGTYSKFVGTSIQSLFENTKEGVCIHLLHDSTLSHENRKKFLQLPMNGNQMILFYNLEKLEPNIISYLTEKSTEKDKKRFTIGMYYRFMMPDVIPSEISKMIYLDGDTIVNVDIKNLWEIDLRDCPLGAASEVEMGVGIEKKSLEIHKTFPTVKKGWVKPENYFNSGVLSIDLNAFRAFTTRIHSGGRGQFSRDNLGIFESTFHKKYGRSGNFELRLLRSLSSHSPNVQ